MNLLDCHSETIHIPGYSQSFGFLIGLDTQTHQILFFSENILAFFSIEKNILHQNLKDVAPIYTALASPDFLQILNSSSRDSKQHLEVITINNKKYYFLYYHHNNRLFLELEEQLDHDFQGALRIDSYEAFQQATSAHEVWENLVQTIYEIIDYDRVMIYQFMEDGSGKVIAEHKQDPIESFLNLHYPESDIPKQARALYLKKKRRIFSNVYQDPVPIISELKEIDLTPTDIRAMSPIHAEYIKNGGFSSSFSVSILVEGKLWGLVTCQNIKAQHIDMSRRIRAELYTAMAANIFSNIESQEYIQLKDNFLKDSFDIRQKIKDYDDLQTSLLANVKVLKDVLECDACIVCVEEKFEIAGEKSNINALKAIRDWFRNTPTYQKNFVSSSFLKDYGDEFHLNSEIAGVIIEALDISKSELVIWIRKEYKEHISWAGKPEKVIRAVGVNGSSTTRISPRKSFEVYAEEIKGCSKSWKRVDLANATNTMELIVEVMQEKFKKIAQLNEDLKILNEELDSFSYTISHDLGTPLTVMKLNAQMLARNPDMLTENKENKLNSILYQINMMETMMRDVLQLSRAKSVDIRLTDLNAKELIDNIAEQTKLSFGSANTKIIIKNTPNFKAEATLAYQVFLNIIGNAVKYSSKKEQPRIEINGEILEDKIQYCISDNGIGIPELDKEQTFKLFKRHDNAKSFGGNGIGLSIVHRIMNRIAGEVYFESQEHIGTKFYISFLKPSE